MPKKNSGVVRAKFDKVKRVKAVARKRVGIPPPARTLSDEQLRDKPKHKKQWAEEE